MSCKPSHRWEYRNSIRVEHEGVGMEDCRVFSIFSVVARHRAFASERVSANTMPCVLERP